ncbi:MAG: hypothetical protein IPK80_35550 [Nannocystis sp.]|nr:hypothetical protein [Nannocystis sp.]
MRAHLRSAGLRAPRRDPQRRPLDPRAYWPARPAAPPRAGSSTVEQAGLKLGIGVASVVASVAQGPAAGHDPEDTWDLRALATVLRSAIAVLFVASYCVKMSGGFRRFQAQYLRRIRIPRWRELTPAQREALRATPATDLPAIDRAVFDLYRLAPAEIAAATAAAAARVGRKS